MSVGQVMVEFVMLFIVLTSSTGIDTVGAVTVRMLEDDWDIMIVEDDDDGSEKVWKTLFKVADSDLFNKLGDSSFGGLVIIILSSVELDKVSLLVEVAVVIVKPCCWQGSGFVGTVELVTFGRLIVSSCS